MNPTALRETKCILLFENIGKPAFRNAPLQGHLSTLKPGFYTGT